MDLIPVLKALLRNKLGAILVAAQIAVTLTVLCNGAFIAWKRYEHMTRPTGMDVMNIFSIAVIGIDEDYDEQGSVNRDVEAIEALPGIISATPINSVPLSGGGWGEGFKNSPDPDQPADTANVYWVNEEGLETLGVTLAEGRTFTRDEILIRDSNERGYPEVVIITRALADQVFGEGEPALGEMIYPDDDPMRVIGILERMQGAWLGWDGVERVAVMPGLMTGDRFTRYLIRTEPGQRDELMATVETTLADLDPRRIVRSNVSMEEYRADSYAGDRAIAVTLLIVIVMLVVITGLGIVGLVSFMVSQRTKQIGTRRALGAQRFHVVRYFLVENWLITSIGLSVGVILTMGLNYWLVSSFSMARLDWTFVPAGLVLIWSLGLLAAFGPARRAARVSPAIATRTV
ncbi:MAG: FtsX-like permease family protein [Pseudomonadota bacterium]